MKRIWCVGFIALLLSFTVTANAKDTAIPDELEPWSSWVLRDNPDIQCPHIYNASQHFCAYPTQLALNIDTNGGFFEQKWSVYGASWITLPGDAMHWPQHVTVNNKSMAIVSKKGRPSLYIKAGSYTIKGKFIWNQSPKSLLLPVNTGLVYVTLNGNKLKQPDIRNGKLWLTSTQTQQHENNRLSLTVFRKIADSNPLKLTTMIEMDVAGLQREVVLDGALLNGFSVSRLTSQLPARLDQNGKLRLQLRPGHWEIYVDSMHNSPVELVQLNAFQSPWPAQEIWVFEHQSHLRQVKILDKNTIDPQQTQLPGVWKQFPAYNMASGEALQWSVIKRGDPEPEPDQLTLKKTLWLDFSGDAYTVKDEISGTLSRNWRLTVTPDVELGRVTIDGQPQYITRLQDEKAEGVEMRQGNVNLIADSRVKTMNGELSATGWESHFNKVNATLNLPMGYRLFSISGAHAPDAWMNKWTLLDLFLVLITAIACHRLWGPTWGVIALATLTLTWHEFDAPRMMWINIIITIALIKVLSEGRLLKLLTIYRNVMMLLLVLISLVFVVYQAQTALYPQLERHAYASQVMHQAVPAKDEAMLQDELLEAAAPMEDYDRQRYEKKSFGISSSRVAKQKKPKILMVDPDAMIQTGPGLPNWNWHNLRIDWDGPVQVNQTIDVTLISPAVHRVLNILRIVLVALLIWRLFDGNTGSWKMMRRYLPGRFTGAWLLVPILCSLNVNDSYADYPSKTLLDDLEKHLLKPAECLPQCAAIESLLIKLSGDTLTLTAKTHVSERVAMPLPVPADKWIPSSVNVDLKRAGSLFRQPNQSLWMLMDKGVHTLEIKGSVAHLTELKIDFQLKPHQIHYDLKGWSADITGDQIKQSRSLGFHRIASSEKVLKAFAVNNDIPLFAEVSRYIELGLDWTVTTRVHLTSGNALPGVLRIPLLEGESVITEGITVKDNQAIISFNKNKQSVFWRSTLPKTDLINMKAASQTAFNEIWQLNTSAIWHIEYEGIPVIYHQRQGQYWQPEWRPWQGEEVSINITRPEGVKGSTKTIDNSHLALTPGESLTTGKLSFNLRSSQGGQHSIRIPADSELMSTKINGNSIPVRLNDGAITLPITPGAQSVEIEWRESRGISAGLFETTKIDMGIESVNTKITIYPGHQRWILFVGGPRLGPAVLFWGVFFLIVGISVGLSRISDMPLNIYHWLLLGIGLSASAPATGLLIVGWLFALRTKSKIPEIKNKELYDAYQVFLAFLTVISLMTLFYVIKQGLLGSPDMQITGNQSGAYILNWYSDRSNSALPTAWIVTVPLMIYRLLMLLWAIWLSFALIQWLRWGWICYSMHGYWKEKVKVKIDKNESEAVNKY